MTTISDEEENEYLFTFEEARKTPGLYKAIYHKGYILVTKSWDDRDRCRSIPNNGVVFIDSEKEFEDLVASVQSPSAYVQPVDNASEWKFKKMTYLGLRLILSEGNHDAD